MAEVAVTRKHASEAALFPKGWNWETPFFGSTHPFALLRDWRRDIDRIFHDFGGLETTDKGWWPAIECKKVNHEFVVTAEVPGLKKDEVKVELTDNALILEGERKYEEKKEEEGYFRSERYYGKFYRSIPLPEGYQTEGIHADLANGVLEVKIPVVEPKTTMRQIPIEEKKEEKKKA